MGGGVIDDGRGCHRSSRPQAGGYSGMVLSAGTALASRTTSSKPCVASTTMDDNATSCVTYPRGVSLEQVCELPPAGSRRVGADHIGPQHPEFAETMHWKGPPTCTYLHTAGALNMGCACPVGRPTRYFVVIAKHREASPNPTHMPLQSKNMKRPDVLLLLPLLLALSCASGSDKNTDGNQAGCTAPLLMCDGRCVDSSHDPQNCGSCGAVCTADEICENALCAMRCVGGTSSCGAGCVDTHRSTRQTAALVAQRADLIRSVAAAPV